MSSDWIPLLSGKSIWELAPDAFKRHVLSLYHKPIPKPIAKKAQKPFTFRLNKKGTVCLRVNRDPKWLSPAEIDTIAKELSVPSSQVWLKVKAKRSGIVVSEIDIEAAENRTSNVGQSQLEVCASNIIELKEEVSSCRNEISLRCFD